LAELTHSNGVERPLRVLIVRTGALGDVLHAMPAVSALRELRPEWMIRWAIEPQWSPLLSASDCVTPGDPRDSATPLVDGWFRVETRVWKQGPFSPSTMASVKGLRQRLRAGNFDVAVDMQGLIRSAVIGRLASARRYVGRAEPREGAAKFFYRERVRVSATHVVEQGCELLGAAVGFPLKPVRVGLPVDAVAEAWVEGLVPDGERFVVMAPTAGWGAKEWPAERYGAVAAELGKAGYRVLVNTASSGNPTAERVVQTSGGAAVAIPCSIAEMIALVRRASLVMAGDTGPLHLAAALERPLVGLYGPTDPRRTGPFGVGARFPGRVLRDAASLTDHTRRSEPEAGLSRVGADEVASAALEVLREAKF
jgi:heptosyltransferase I